MIKVVTPKIGLDGCSWYRSRLPLDKAKELGLIDLRELDTDKQDTKEIMELIKGAEVFYLRFSMAKAAAFIRDIRENYPDKKIVFDTDDDLLNVNYLSDSYATFGTKEIYKDDGTPIWREGTQFDPWDNRKRMIDYEYCLSKADIVTVTTLHLADTVKAYNPNVAVIPNAIDPSRFPRVRIDKGDELRLLWHGGASHYQDLWSVKADLDRLMKDYPNLHFYLYGQPFPAITKDMPSERVHTAYWINADGHGYRLATVGADVAICPLVESDFNQNKSSIKYYENSALKIPTVAKKMLPYEADIIDGQNGLLYTNNLYAQVKRLLDDPLLRQDIGNRAFDWVEEHRSLDQVGQDLGDLFVSLIQTSMGFETRTAPPIRKLSIVIPTHNRLELAKQTIESLRQHTPRDLYELIVVDDDSTDGTREWLKTQDIDQLIEANHHACGLSKNLGIEAASHNYIYVSDADMYFDQDWYRDLIRVYPTLPPMILGALGHPWWPTQKTFEGVNLVEQQPGYSWLITKDIYQKCGPLIETRVPGEDDTEFCNRAKKQGIFVGYLPTNKVFHCGITRADGSITYGWEDQVKDYPSYVMTK